VENDIVYYTVSDSSGNETTVQRVIERTDVTKPIITLKGDESITIKAGTAYAEPGYQATDNVDGDITDKVTITGSVNIYHADTYKLTYTVTDSYGNTGTAERTVIVEPIKQPATVYPDSKVVYLTFDDGPRGQTMRLLEILKKYNVKATFFVVDTGNYKTMKAITDAGHAIGMHSVTHDYNKIYASEEAFFNDLYKMQSIIKNATGVTTTLMRFPGGSSNAVSRFNPGIMTRLTKAVTDQGFQYFDWNASSGDAGGVSGTRAEKTAQVVQNVMDDVTKNFKSRNYAIVLQHDTYDYSVDAVEEIIVRCLNEGYSFQILTPSSPTAHHQVNN
jgi:peptidoglycan/xylan/chitin deacetylase (PgdA/CDA1 family)